MFFDIFGIKKRRALKEAERQAQIQEEKRRYQERKKLITDYLSMYMKKQTEQRDKEYEEEKKRVNSVNSKCPKCGSTNVVNHIKRAKGEIHGNGTISGFSSSSLFSSHSSLHGHSKIDGKLDTYPVNKCNECGHEWEIEKAEFDSPYNIFSEYSSVCPDQLYFRLSEYLELTYDPNDIKEECNSLEEKREKYISEHKSYSFCGLEKVPRYMIEYMLYRGISHYHFRLDDADSGFGLKDDSDEYSYQMPDELWKVIKQLINSEEN